MPYISGEDREQYQESITDIASKIKCSGARAGHLNYVITRLLHEVLGDDARYANYNEIIGMLECCKLEFYRHVIGPYEDVKIMQNGDVQ